MVWSILTTDSNKKIRKTIVFLIGKWLSEKLPIFFDVCKIKIVDAAC